MPADTEDFQDFQRRFAHHLRDPRRTPRPAGVPARRMAVYRELLDNNIRSFTDSCFPLCRSLLGEAGWRRLNRSFFRDWPLHTPWFREIPREFVRYLATADIRQRLPAWFAELGHYEWAELAVDVSDAHCPACHGDGDLLADPIVLNPALMNLSYAWPVHRIGPGYRPRKPVATRIVVYRDVDDSVQFTEINAASARLLTILADKPVSGTEALRQIAVEIQHPAPEQLLAHGRALLDDLRRQGIVLGTTV